MFNAKELIAVLRDYADKFATTRDGKAYNVTDGMFAIAEAINNLAISIKNNNTK